MKKHYPLAAILAFFGICFYMFYDFYMDAKKQAVDELNSRQKIHAAQAARGIEEYFHDWFRHLKIISKDDSIIVFDDEGKKILGDIYHENKGKILGVTRVDAQGKVIYTVPIDETVAGTDISHRKHIREIMSTHRPVVSDVFTAVQGFDTIAIIVPVFTGEIYVGCIGVHMHFQEIGRRYLEDIKIGTTGYAWMTSSNGIELYCPVPGHVGKSVFENCKDFPSIIAMAHEMLQGKQGIASYSFDKIREYTVEPVTKHAVLHAGQDRKYLLVHCSGGLGSRSYRCANGFQKQAHRSHRVTSGGRPPLFLLWSESMENHRRRRETKKSGTGIAGKR